MTSSSIIDTNDNVDIKKKNINEKLYNNSINCFKAFNSVLFMNEFFENEDIQVSKESNKDNENKIKLSQVSNESKNSKDEKDFKISPTLEKCLTSELLDSITKDSNKNKKMINNLCNINEPLDNEKINQTNNNNKSLNYLKITKSLFNEEKLGTEISNKEEKSTLKKKEKKGKTIYDETINGFEYQLKFIENSVNNILPKSYKEINEKNNKKIYPLDFSNKLSINNNYEYSFYQKENIGDYYNVNNIFDSEETSLNKKENKKEKENTLQVHKLKITDIDYSNWICKYCYCLNRGYRKVCSNCSNLKKLII